MSDTGPRPLPQSTVQAAGQAATEVISGLKQQPLLLGIVVLNIIGIAAALWFLHEIMNQQHERSTQLLGLIKGCMPGAAVDWPTVTQWPPYIPGDDPG